MQAGAEAINERRDWSAAREWTQSLLSAPQCRPVICGILQLLIHTAVSSSVQPSAGGLKFMIEAHSEEYETLTSLQTEEVHYSEGCCEQIHSLQASELERLLMRNHHQLCESLQADVNVLVTSRCLSNG